MSQDQLRTLGSFLYPGKVNSFLSLYNEATNKPFGHLVIDSKQSTDDDERLKTNVFDEEEKLLKKEKSNTKESVESEESSTPSKDVLSLSNVLDNEREVARSYHGPFIKWMGKSPLLWEHYLQNMLYDDLTHVINPNAIAHLAVFRSRNEGHSLSSHCPNCKKIIAICFLVITMSSLFRRLHVPKG